MRKIICKYIKIVYQSETLKNNNDNNYYSVDESLINHYNGKQVWLIGICNNITKDFRIEASYKRDTEVLKEFINMYAEKNSFIITDVWPGYGFLDEQGSGYTRIKHIHGGGDFGFSHESTSHIEGIWSQIKSSIKEKYHLYPYQVFMQFVREIEFKIKIRSLSNEDKIKKFFECYNLAESIEDICLKS